MTDRGRAATDALATLRVALGQTAEALAHPRLDTLLASEAGLAAALAVLQVRPGVGDRAFLLDDLGRIRAELSRCRRLGGSLSGILGSSIGNRGAAGDYGRDGRPSEHARPSSTGTLEARG